MKENLKKKKHIWIEYWFIFLTIIIFFINLFLFSLWTVSWHSMDNTLRDKQFIIIDRISYDNIPLIWNIKDYKRGDIIVFNSRIKKEKDKITWKDKLWAKNLYVKRIIGIWWDTIKIVHWYVFIKYKNTDKYIKLNESYLNTSNNRHTYVWFDSVSEYKYTVPMNNFFVLWDNRKFSNDSRICFEGWCKTATHSAFVKRNDIIWKVIIK